MNDSDVWVKYSGSIGGGGGMQGAGGGGGIGIFDFSSIGDTVLTSVSVVLFSKLSSSVVGGGGSVAELSVVLFSAFESSFSDTLLSLVSGEGGGGVSDVGASSMSGNIDDGKLFVIEGLCINNSVFFSNPLDSLDDNDIRSGIDGGGGKSASDIGDRERMLFVFISISGRGGLMHDTGESLKFSESAIFSMPVKEFSGFVQHSRKTSSFDAQESYDFVIFVSLSAVRSLLKNGSALSIFPKRFSNSFGDLTTSTFNFLSASG